MTNYSEPSGLRKGVLHFPPVKKNNLKQALFWHRRGFAVTPIIPGQKRPATKWDEWENSPSEEKVRIHWRKHPDHEVGCLTSENLIVFDADSPESLDALEKIEEGLSLDCKLINKTPKGEHHFFKLKEGVSARLSSHSTEKFPERIDIKTGRSLVVLPLINAPFYSKRRIKHCEVNHVSELTLLGQEEVDAFYCHNGSEKPRQKTEASSRPRFVSATLSKLRTAEALLVHIDPDSGYDDWRNVGMGLHNYFSGGDEGLDLFDQWSSKGQKYPGRREIENKWKSFSNYSGEPITIATLYQLAKDNGTDLSKIPHEDDFVVCEAETIVIEPVKGTGDPVSKPPENPLLKYSLTGKSHEFREQMEEEQFILDSIALMGQWTNFFGQPNTGKTLLTTSSLMEKISSGKSAPEKIFYINADDTLQGLTAKLELAEESGFHMLAPGHLGFKTDQLPGFITHMCESNTAKGVVIFLDTAKKFVDPMSKTDARRFGNLIRMFVSHGGTAVILAHANKNLGADGKPIYGGTSDLVDDADCAYTLRTIETDADNQTKTVEFENIKNRGNVKQRVAFKYSIEEGLSYPELLSSVEQVDDETASKLRDRNTIESSDSESEVIEAVLACLAEGVCKKMELAQDAAQKARVSKRAALRVIEKFTGEDPGVHR